MGGVQKHVERRIINMNNENGFTEVTKRKFVDFDAVKNQRQFWLYFLGTNFPNGYVEETDEYLSEFIDSQYDIMEWSDEFAGYYEGVLDSSDGYVENPTTLKIELSTKNNLFIEFHPGDTIYFIDDDEIGCTGPEYFIHKINWKDFCAYTKELDNREKLLLIPMLKIENSEQEQLKKAVCNGLELLPINEMDNIIYGLREAIVNNCLE